MRRSLHDIRLANIFCGRANSITMEEFSKSNGKKTSNTSTGKMSNESDPSNRADDSGENESKEEEKGSGKETKPEHRQEAKEPQVASFQKAIVPKKSIPTIAKLEQIECDKIAENSSLKSVSKNNENLAEHVSKSPEEARQGICDEGSWSNNSNDEDLLVVVVDEHNEVHHVECQVGEDPVSANSSTSKGKQIHVHP